jgi:hypothetical protein
MELLKKIQILPHAEQCENNKIHLKHFSLGLSKKDLTFLISKRGSAVLRLAEIDLQNFKTKFLNPKKDFSISLFVDFTTAKIHF